MIRSVKRSMNSKGLETHSSFRPWRPMTDALHFEPPTRVAFNGMDAYTASKFVAFSVVAPLPTMNVVVLEELAGPRSSCAARSRGHAPSPSPPVHRRLRQFQKDLGVGVGRGRWRCFSGAPLRRKLLRRRRLVRRSRALPGSAAGFILPSSKHGPCPFPFSLTVSPLLIGLFFNKLFYKVFYSLSPLVCQFNSFY